jgi:asparagine synthase (glutamine-hydrolysing)
VRTFTVGYDVGGVSEATPARAGAAALGTEHHELILRSGDVEALSRTLYGRLDQPIADQALLASHAVSRFAREQVKVVVGGEGADELFGGYPRYRWLGVADRVGRVVPPVVGRMVGRGIRQLVPAGRPQRVGNVIEPASAMQRHLDWVTDGRAAARDAFYGPALRPDFGAASLPDPGAEDTARALMRLDQSLWLPDDVLAKADRASMLASLEVRTPFLQLELASFAAMVPTSLHLADGGKALLRALLRKRLRTTHGRAKVAFRVPAAEWLRGPLVPVLREQLADGRLYSEGYFDRGAVSRAVDEHVSGVRDRTAVLWPLMVLGLWVDRVGGGPPA